MKEKKCFKCGVVKSLDDFYKHPRMGDGHLNKCKECTKKDVHKDYSKNSQDEEWMEKERERGREKYHRLGYREDSERRISNLFWYTSEYKGLRKWAKKRILIKNSEEIHHWNYTRIKDFFIIDKRLHAQIHKLLVVNENTGLFTVKETGELLNTKQKHILFILGYLKTLGECNYKIGFYDFTVNESKVFNTEKIAV